MHEKQGKIIIRDCTSNLVVALSIIPASYFSTTLFICLAAVTTTSGNNASSLILQAKENMMGYLLYELYGKHINWFVPPAPMLMLLLHTRSREFSKVPFRPAGMRFEPSENKPLACVQYHYQHGIWGTKTHYFFIYLFLLIQINNGHALVSVARGP